MAKDTRTHDLGAASCLALPAKALAGAAGGAAACRMQPQLFWLEDRFCRKAVLAGRSLELWSVNKYNKIGQNGCILLRASIQFQVEECV